jgi:hypothetical protein
VNKIKNNIMKAKIVKESLNESFSIPLTIAAAFCLYQLIKGILKQKYDKISPQERLDKVTQKLDVVNYKILLRYIKKYLENGGKVKFEEDYLYYKFIVNEVTIKIDKNNRKIFWTYLGLEHFGDEFKPMKNRMRLDRDIEESDYIDPIPISQEEIDGLVEAIKEEENEE